MKKQLIDTYKDKASISLLLEWTGLSRSSYYYKERAGKRGRKPSTTTRTKTGIEITNDEVIKILVDEIYSKQEFNQYGYLLTTCELKDLGLIINRKKVYRLMKEHGLLLNKPQKIGINKQWVKWRSLPDVRPMEYICMDIKYVYIEGIKRNAYLLAIMDVCTRYVLSWSLQLRMRHHDVILCLNQILKDMPVKEIKLRTDNGSQFIAKDLEKFLLTKGITHEFTHVATPEENSYVESLFSNVEREVIKRYEFESLYHAKDVFNRYFHWYNTQRRHHSLGRISPLKYWHTFWDCHPVRPPLTVKDFSVQDFFKKNTTRLGLEIFFEKPHRAWSCTEKSCRLSLPNQDDNIRAPAKY